MFLRLDKVKDSFWILILVFFLLFYNVLDGIVWLLSFRLGFGIMLQFFEVEGMGEGVENVL